LHMAKGESKKKKKRERSKGSEVLGRGAEGLNISKSAKTGKGTLIHPVLKENNYVTNQWKKAFFFGTPPNIQ